MRFVISPNCDMIRDLFWLNILYLVEDLQVDKVERICKYSQERIDSIFPLSARVGWF